MGIGHTSESLVIVDDNKLRQAAFSCLLERWAHGHNMTIAAMCLAEIPSALQQCPAPRLILLSVGGTKVSNPLGQRSLRLISAAMPKTPVVILSDLEEGEDVVAAFNGGAQGFLTTSLVPEIALQALSIIFNGGSFFPSSALRYLSKKSPPSSAEYLMCENGAEKRNTIVAASSSDLRLPHQVRNLDAAASPLRPPEGLTERQQHVLKLLCTGLSNKLIARELGMTEATVKVHVRHAMRKLGASNRTEAAIIATSLRLEMADGPPASKAVQLPVSHEIGQRHRISVRVYGRVCENGKNAIAHGNWETGRGVVERD